jgi:hypothetical protein
LAFRRRPLSRASRPFIGPISKGSRQSIAERIAIVSKGQTAGLTESVANGEF